MPSSLLSSMTADKCELPFRDPSGRIVWFDIQPADPGTFTVPGVIDLESYEPGELVETSWIFFKGDPQAGPQPGHPFERPFNDSAKFSLDLVRDDNTSKVLREIMREFLPSVTSGHICHRKRVFLTGRQPQHPPIPRPSGKAARLLVDRATTPCTSRASTARASTTSLAR